MAGTYTKHIPTRLCPWFCVTIDKNNPGPAENLSQESVQGHHCVSAISKEPAGVLIDRELNT